MARISLRAYNREIENLIERAQIEQAIAHCRHILRTFPKNIDTYRLLGKAFLESQRFGDAADIFQRVLSSVPEDFVSHVGMSIIREDEGNLDEALWHMERAFEMQPANGAIQDELRRLYGRRDGFEPPKVRLTRGALARMYAKGELYQQAIAELRAALAEDSKRLDLQGLLALVYFNSGQRVESVETCSSLLRKLPYSLEANRIMAEVLAGSERADEARTYRQRVQSLDPYMAHVSPAAPSVEQVPDQAVAIEKLVWQADQSLQGRSQPAWAASLGVELQEESDKDALPEWLAAAGGDFEEDREDSEESRADGEELEDMLEAGEAEMDEESQDWRSAIGEESEEESFEDEIPEWMQDVGWMAAGEAAREGLSSEDAAEAEQEDLHGEIGTAGEETADEDLAEAEIPDWLQAMAPSEEDTPPVEDQADFLMDEEESVPEAELPDWMLEEEAGAPEAEMGAEEMAAAETPSPESELPEWLANDAAAAAESVSDESLPEWLKELDTEETETDLQASAEEEEILIEQVETEEEAPDWLSEVDEAAGQEEEELPDWLLEEEQEVPLEEPPTEFEPEVADKTPEQTSEATIEESHEGEIEELEEAAAEAPAVEEPGAEEPALEEPVVEEPVAETPTDWIPEALETEQELGEADQPEGELEEPRTIEDEDAAYAWLEALAAKQGAQEGLLLEEEDRQEVPPDWVEQSLKSELEVEQPGIPEIPEVPELPHEPETEALSAGEMPAEELETTPEEPAGEIPTEEADEGVPDWLLEGMSATGTEVPEAEIQEAIEEPGEVLSEAGEEEATVTPEGLPESELEAQTEAISELDVEGEPEPTLEMEDTQPTWVADADAFPATEELEEAQDFSALGEEEPEAEALDSEAAFAWLEGLAAKRGVEEGLLLDAQDREEAPPDWAQEETQVEAEKAPEAVSETGEEEKPSGVPAWLQPEDTQVSPDEETKPTRIRAAAEREEGAAEEKEAEGLPSWLVEMQEEEPQAEVEIPVQEEPPSLEETPAEEAFEETLQETSAYEALEETLEEVPEQETTPPDLSDEEAAFAWLESLAAKQGATEGLLLDDEERSETAPEWVQETTAEEEREPAEIQMDEESILESAEEGELAEIQAEEAPELEETLQQPEVEAGLETMPTEEVLEEGLEEDLEEGLEEPVAEVHEAPDWLQDLDTQEEGLEEEPESAPVQETETLEPPDWVKDETFAEEAIEVEDEQEIPELPSWLSEEALVEEQEEAWTPPVQPFDLNEASLAELEKLPGIGFIMAQEIVTHRDNYGPYESLDDLLRVPGIEEGTLEPLRERLFVKAPQKEEAGMPAFAGDEEAPEAVRQARQAFLEGDLEQATQHYLALIKAHEHLPMVIRDLKEALNRYPADAALWQALGDAYLRADQLEEALEAYDKAEELIR